MARPFELLRGDGRRSSSPRPLCNAGTWVAPDGPALTTTTESMMSRRNFPMNGTRRGTMVLLLGLGWWVSGSSAKGQGPYWLAVSNERSGDVTLIDGSSRQVVATIPVGKRPRGIHASPDGRSLYVALSGSPITGPPALDAQGRPIRKEDEDEDNADHSADGIGVIDVA